MCLVLLAELGHLALDLLQVHLDALLLGDLPDGEGHLCVCVRE